MDDSTCLVLADRHVDIKLHNWWQKALWEKSITSATWANFKTFMRECFMPSSTVVPPPKPMITVEVIKQPAKVMHGIEDVGNNIAPIPKVATAVTTHDKLIVVHCRLLARWQP
jgi:hypothetical protein